MDSKSVRLPVDFSSENARLQNELIGAAACPNNTRGEGAF
jgi:hypothetical protein